jgi:hypothetical protein
MISLILLVLASFGIAAVTAAYDYRYEPQICSRDPDMKCITNGIAQCTGAAKKHVLALQDWGRFDQLQIHGLWREEDCHCADGEAAKDSFEMTKLSLKTRAQMDLYWNAEIEDFPTQGKANCHLWEHEWNCHGICSGLGQEAYFRKALDLYQKYRKCAVCDPKDGNCSLIHLDENFESDCLGSSNNNNNNNNNQNKIDNKNNNDVTPVSGASRMNGNNPYFLPIYFPLILLFLFLFSGWSFIGVCGGGGRGGRSFLEEIKQILVYLPNSLLLMFLLIISTLLFLVCFFL